MSILFGLNVISKIQQMIQLNTDIGGENDKKRRWKVNLSLPAAG
jgi:hypothetical protein